MSQEKFKVVKHSSKTLAIEGPWELGVVIDYDDVNHKQVKREAEALADLLNHEWEHIVLH